MKLIKNKLFYFLSLLAVFLVGLVLIKPFADDDQVLGEVAEDWSVNIAACPTYIDFLSLIDADINLIEAGSTSEGFGYLSTGRADFVLAGRILKPGEEEFPFHILGQGYSFLSGQEKFITEQDLLNLSVFTDLDINEVNRVFNLNNLYPVDNVYDFLDQGIVITSWENTDYSKAEIVHLISPDGSRNSNSRIPILYCSNLCDNQMVDLLKSELDK